MKKALLSLVLLSSSVVFAHEEAIVEAPVVETRAIDALTLEERAAFDKMSVEEKAEFLKKRAVTTASEASVVPSEVVAN